MRIDLSIVAAGQALFLQCLLYLYTTSKPEVSDMSIDEASGTFSFPTDYRAIVMISTGLLKRQDFHGIRKVVLAHLDEAEKANLFYGSCFGRYDIVYDFPSGSAKIASYKTILIQRSIVDPSGLGIKCSTSQLLCRQIPLDTSGDGNGPIRAYVMLKLKRDELPVKDAKDAILHVRSQVKGAALLWNLSIFTLIVVLDSDSLADILGAIPRIRSRLRDVVLATNTIITLGFEGVDSVRPGSINALTLVKTKGFVDSKWNISEFGFTGCLRSKWPVGMTGWYDLCMMYRGDSLDKFQQDFFNLKDKHRDIISDSVTLFLNPRWE